MKVQETPNLNLIPNYYQVSFTGVQNSAKLRILFSYGLPCIYSGVTMIDPKLLTRWVKNGVFNRSAQDVFQIIFDTQKNSFCGNEAKVINILRERTLLHPDRTIRELLQEIKPVFSKRLRRKQNPVFKELLEVSHELPEEYRFRARTLMLETSKKLNSKPLIIPFSSYEFKYKLNKIRNDIYNGENLKAKKVINKLLKESKKFSNTTNAITIDNQKQVLNFIEKILRRSILKDNDELNELLTTSKLRLNKEEIIVPFSRKSFIYDLARLIEDIPDRTLQEKILSIAQKLPTSQDSLSAFIAKIADESSEKIGFRLIWPYIASVEHLHPKSEGGLNELANYAGATALENSMRKSIPFTQQMKLRPKTAQYCQKYVDRLVELYKTGVFARHNINPKYISDFANTIYHESNQQIKLIINLPNS